MNKMPARGSLSWNILFIICGLNQILLASDSPRYQIHTLEENKVCSLRNYVTKPLVVGESSAIIIKQTKYFKQFTGENEFKCMIIVKTSFENFGLFGVVQKINLRKNLEDNECIDYVEVCNYKENPLEKVTGIHYASCQVPLKRFCGLPSEGDDDSSLKPSGFVGRSGQIAVKIVLAKKRVEPNETMDLEIAFTSFIPCRRDVGSNKMCSSPSTDEGACIYKDYFNDGVLNCPYKGCADECGIDNNSVGGAGVEPSLSTKVTVTAVSSIFLSFFFFLGCIWLCRSCEVLCWSVEGLRNTATRAHTDARRDSELRPSAPPELPSLSSVDDKDLPPAYETLFPES